MRTSLVAFSLLTVLQSFAHAEVPTANYIFPAGGQRGTNVTVRIGGCNLHRSPRLIWPGTGIVAPATLQPIETVWFEGPIIPQPASQQKEDYPRDFNASLQINADATLGRRAWRLATSQGITPALGFIVGPFPEVIEKEYEGEAPPTRVSLPTTINGRIFPREDVDAWSFLGKKDQRITIRTATSEFGSPLDARIEVRDAEGKVLGEQLPEGIFTPDLSLVLPLDGEYVVRIHDVGFGGLQDHVYRLTLTDGPVLQSAFPLGGRRGASTQFQLEGINLPVETCRVELPLGTTEYFLRLPNDQTSLGEVRIDLDDLPELVEGDIPGQEFIAPCVINGRIKSPGEVDLWIFTAKKGIEYDFEVRAVRLGSMLDSVIEIQDSTGEKLADADDSQGLQTDSRLRWSAPADGEYRFVVRDRLTSRGGDRYAYRVRITTVEQPDFSLTSIGDCLTLERGKSANLKINVERGPSFNEPITLTLDGLPAGVTVTSPATPIMIAANQRDIQLTFKTDVDSVVNVAPIKIVGRAKGGDTELVRTLTPTPAHPEQGRIALADGTGSLWVAVAVPTPFKFVGAFETKFIPRGSVFVRKYHIDRNGFDGPLEVQLADRQGRHLQGVTAETVIVPAGESDFEFAVKLAPRMEIGRTCRSTLAASGVVVDADGTRHDVNFSSNDQNNQMIALVDAGRFAIQLSRTSLAAEPGMHADVPFRIQRSHGLTGPVTLNVIAAEPIQGVSAKPITLDANSTQGTVAIEFAGSISGVSVRPLTIRALTTDERGFSLVAETQLTLVSGRHTARGHE